MPDLGGARLTGSGPPKARPLLVPLLVYDGACECCRMWIARWRRLTGERIEYAPFQQAAERIPGLQGVPREAFARAVHLIEPDGRITRGAEAALRSLASAPGLGLPLWFYRFVPGFAPLAEAGYGWVAAHRPLCARVTRALGGRDPGE